MCKQICVNVVIIINLDKRQVRCDKIKVYKIMQSMEKVSIEKFSFFPCDTRIRGHPRKLKVGGFRAVCFF